MPAVWLSRVVECLWRLVGSQECPVRRICVFCGSKAGEDPEYAQVAGMLGRVLADRGIGLVYGGGEGFLSGGCRRSLFVRETDPARLLDSLLQLIEAD